MDQAPPANLRARSLRGGAWAAAGAMGASAAGLASFLVLSRILGPEAYGLMAMVEAVLAFSQKLMASGLSEPLIQMPHAREDHSDTLFWTLQLTGLILTGLTAALSTWVGAFFEQPALPPLVVAAAFTLYLQSIGLVPGALLARRFGFRDTAQASIVSELAGGIAGIAAALQGSGAWALVIQRIAASSVASGVLLWKARWRPHFRFSLHALREVWKFSASRGLEGMLHYCDQQLPRILLGRVAGATELGYFVFARRIVENTVQLFSGPIRVAALSTFAAIQTDLHRVRRTYAEGTGLTASAIIPASAGIALVAPYLVQVLVGPHWEPSILLLQLLVMASIRQSFHLWNGALLRGLGRPQDLLVASLVRSLTIIGLISVSLRWGAPGVCIAVLAGSYISWPIAMQFVKRASGMGVIDQLRAGRAPLLSTAIMGIIVIAFQRSMDGQWGPWPMLLASAGLGAVSYAASMSLFGRAEITSLWHNLRTLRKGSPARPILKEDEQVGRAG